jgi:DNA-binding CsgD family transcriptional regulator
MVKAMWQDTFERLSKATSANGGEAGDLEDLAVAAYMTGRDDVCEQAWIAAHRAWLRRGEPERAARCAFRHALGLFFRGDLAPALGWVERGRRMLEDTESDTIEHVWLRMLTELPRLFQGDPSVGSTFVEAEAAARRLGDVDATVFAWIGRGYALILERRTSEGMALLDQVMVSVTAEEVTHVLSGIAYCQVISLCHAAFDVRRAREWTAALSRWCDRQPDIVPFRGNCLVHRCEILQLEGAWNDALQSARQACTWLAGPPAWDALGSAHYQLAEIQRLRGDFADAEQSYRLASLAGRDPEPGMSLLRLALGRIDLALPSIRRALDEAKDPATRARLLPAYVEISLQAGEAASARAGADALAELALECRAPLLEGLAAEASGAVLLTEGKPNEALPQLRKAERIWRDLETRHQLARIRILIGVACRQLGDEASAELEFASAEQVLRDLGALPDLARLAELAASSRPTGPLSPREVEVLKLVATGMTNRAIASSLFISDKTVARHISNMFTKLGLSSRAEATAYAFKHGLAR